VAVTLKDGHFSSARTAPPCWSTPGSPRFVSLCGRRTHWSARDGKTYLSWRGSRSCGPRFSSVFPVAPGPALEAPDFEHGASIVLQERLERSALRAKIHETGIIAKHDDRVFEVHPEVSFWAMAGRHLQHPKWTWAGFWERLHSLRVQGIELPEDAGGASLAAPDDVLDAAAAAWTAWRLARGIARPVPEPEPEPETSYGARPVTN
jgi:predicted RNase H-like nuclease